MSSVHRRVTHAGIFSVRDDVGEAHVRSFRPSRGAARATTWRPARKNVPEEDTPKSADALDAELEAYNVRVHAYYMPTHGACDVLCNALQSESHDLYHACTQGNVAAKPARGGRRGGKGADNKTAEQLESEMEAYLVRVPSFHVLSRSPMTHRPSRCKDDHTFSCTALNVQRKYLREQCSNVTYCKSKAL